MTKCPKCGSNINRHSTVQLKGSSGFKTIGHHYFCTNMNCSYEVDE